MVNMEMYWSNVTQGKLTLACRQLLIQEYKHCFPFPRNVTLVVLKSESDNPPAPEDIQLQMSPPSEEQNNIAFNAKVFDITEFQEDTIEISLQSKEKRRRKRNAFKVDALVPASKYRAAQMNTDESGVGKKTFLDKRLNFNGRS